MYLVLFGVIPTNICRVEKISVYCPSSIYWCIWFKASFTSLPSFFSSICIIGNPFINRVVSKILFFMPGLFAGLCIWFTTWYTVSPAPTCLWSNTVKIACLPLSKSTFTCDTPLYPYKNWPASYGVLIADIIDFTWLNSLSLSFLPSKGP